VIVVPQPMPDEIERSILGRTIRLNGLGARQSADAIKNVRRVAGIDTSRVGSTVGLIAFLVQRDPRDFVRHHTLFPWWIVLRLGKWLDAEGRLRDRSLAQTIQPHRPFVSLCPDCVLEDLQFHGLSYWRRSHQLSGAYECLKHGAGLRHYVDVDIVQTLPSEALDREPYRVSSLLRDSERYFQQTYTDLGENQCSISSSIAYARLKKLLVSEMDVTSALGAQTEIQARLEDRFSAVWMREVVPGFCRTAQESVSGSLSGFLGRSKLYGPGYLLALAISVADREEDVAELFASCPSETEVENSEVRRSRIGRSRLARAYVRNRGLYAAFLPRQEVQREACKARLAAMGLPDLDEPLLEAVRLFYMEDLPISEAIQRSGVELKRFEAALRIAGMSLRQAFEQMAGLRSEPQRS